ncbi:serine/threonine-protein kinase [Chondromyces crocatus]|uniref:serine/threonine-protein kinase n=1 Tax=Chondromyces crocatus TaxID=52 RepID=UPI00146FFCAA|nr:serine/threonine-protein kinase [Chondromyces crocatus]
MRQIGAGGMGAVWLADHVQLGSEVAIKFMATDAATSSAARARFEREARTSAKLSHPNIVHVQDYGITGDQQYLVMERLVGEDLGERLKREGKIPLGELSVLAIQIGRGLRRIHDAGLVHRDLKPSNIFLVTGEDGESLVKLLDLGIVKSVIVSTGEGTNTGESTRTGEIVGSPHYMSPEQVQGRKSLGIQSDLWSFGVVLFRAMTGQMPFKGEGIGSLIAAILTSPLPSPSSLAPELPADIDRFFQRALAREPEQRFQSARDLVDALLEMLGTRPSAVSMPFLVAPTPSSPRGPLSPGAPSSPPRGPLSPGAPSSPRGAVPPAPPRRPPVPSPSSPHSPVMPAAPGTPSAPGVPSAPALLVSPRPPSEPGQPVEGPAAAQPLTDTLVSLFNRTGAPVQPQRKAMLIGTSMGAAGLTVLGLVWMLSHRAPPDAAPGDAAPSPTVSEEARAQDPAPPPQASSIVAEVATASAAVTALATADPASAEPPDAEPTPTASPTAHEASRPDAKPPAATGTTERQTTQRTGTPATTSEPEGPLRPPRVKRRLGF